ncbi:MAG: hypothetical protein M1838_002678 [Thelocarpon superellum]|nr:MAG: hypothetical protein M1838_002678 [Thelocarpon superellum]
MPVLDAKERVGSSSSVERDLKKQSQSQSQDAAPASAPKGAPEEPEYPPPAQVAAVVAALCLAIFLVALDRTIIATAIPSITDDFHSLDDIGWYGSAFLLTSCCFLLLIGRIYTFYSPKYVFLAVITVFEVGSAVCGAAPNSTVFIIGRAIAGVGCAGVMNGGITLLACTVPLAKRPRYQGLFGASFGIASVFGPLLGGAFTSNVTWRWCFYINLPIGACTIAIIAFVLKPTPAGEKGVPLKQQFLQLDPLGIFFIVPSLVCLLLALQWGGSAYDWSDGRIVALLVVFAVLILAFTLVQIFKNDTATIPARIIKNRSILAAQAYIFCLGSAMLVLIYYVPLWFQTIKGVGAVKSGIMTFPMIISLVLGIILSGVVTEKLHYYTPLAYAAAVLAPIGGGLISTWNPATNYSMWIGYQVLSGFGLGIGFQQPNMAAQTVLARPDVPTGVSIVQFAQLLGGAVFLSVAQNILSSRLASGLGHLVPHLDPHTVGNLGATELRSLVKPEKLGELLEVYNGALRQVFYLATGLAATAVLGAAALEWKSVKAPEKKAAGDERVE